MIYLLKMKIFHGELLNNQRVILANRNSRIINWSYCTIMYHIKRYFGRMNLMNPLYILYQCDQFWPSQWLIVYGRWICGFYPFLDSRKNTIIGTWGLYGISISTNIDPHNGMFGGWKAVFQLPQLASSQNLRSRGSIDIWMTQSNQNHVGS